MGRTGEILVVDDDVRIRKLVTKVLAREGYAVRAATGSGRAPRA
jgi:DNA-binding response OmpR family regulator